MKKILLLLIVPFFLSNCASIVSKSNYPVVINSDPSNAKVTVTDKNGYTIFSGQTPAMLKLKSSFGFFSKAEYQVKLSYEGYDSKILMITSSLDGWYLGNIFFGGLIGMLIIDPATGAMWKIDRENIFEELIPTDAKNTTLHIMDINNVPADMRDQLIPISH